MAIMQENFETAKNATNKLEAGRQEYFDDNIKLVEKIKDQQKLIDDLTKTKSK